MMRKWMKVSEASEGVILVAVLVCVACMVSMFCYLGLQASYLDTHEALMEERARVNQMAERLDTWQQYAGDLEARGMELEALIDKLQERLIESEYGRTWSIELVPSGVD